MNNNNEEPDEPNVSKSTIVDEDECNAEPPLKRKRFDASSSKVLKSKWELSEDLAQYLEDKKFYQKVRFARINSSG